MLPKRGKRLIASHSGCTGCALFANTFCASIFNGNIQQVGSRGLLQDELKLILQVQLVCLC